MANVVRNLQGFRVSERDLLDEISGSGVCEATNCELAERLGVSGRTVQRWIQELKAEALIDVEIAPMRGVIGGRVRRVTRMGGR